jgi:hypothetical protein
MAGASEDESASAEEDEPPTSTTAAAAAMAAITEALAEAPSATDKEPLASEQDSSPPAETARPSPPVTLHQRDPALARPPLVTVHGPDPARPPVAVAAAHPHPVTPPIPPKHSPEADVLGALARRGLTIDDATLLPSASRPLARWREAHKGRSPKEAEAAAALITEIAHAKLDLRLVHAKLTRIAQLLHKPPRPIPPKKLAALEAQLHLFKNAAAKPAPTEAELNRLTLHLGELEREASN